MIEGLDMELASFSKRYGIGLNEFATYILELVFLFWLSSYVAKNKDEIVN